MSHSGQAVILVGGKGTRLAEVTTSTPKPLVTVGDVPFLEHLLVRCAHYGLSQITLLSGHLHGQIEAFAAQAMTRRPDMSIRCIAETEPLGTAGALKHAAAHLEDSFFLMNGDSIFDFDWNQLRKNIRSDAAGIIALREVENAGRFGSVELDGQRIKSFSEKSQEVSAGLINGGVYFLRREILDEIGSGPASLEMDIFPNLAAQGRLDGLIRNGEFIDIGIPQDLERAQSLVPAWNRAFD